MKRPGDTEASVDRSRRTVPSRTRNVYEIAFDNARDAVCIVDEKARFVAVNRAATALTGYAQETLLTKRLVDLCTWPTPMPWQHRWQRLVAEDQDGQRVELRNRDGGTVRVELSTGVLVASEGTYLSVTMVEADSDQIEGVSEFTCDVTTQRRAKKRLNDQLSWHKQVFDGTLESVSDHVYIFDHDIRFRYVSRSAAVALGKTVPEMIGKRWSELDMPPGIMTAFERQVREVLDTGRDCRGDVVYPTAEGPRHVEYVVSRLPVSDECGPLIVNVARDVTERRRTESAFRESECFLAEVLNSYPGNVAILNEQGRIISFNGTWRAFARANGLDANRVDVGTDYLAVCRAAEGPGSEGALETADVIEAILRGDRQTYQTEYPCHSPDKERWFNLRAQGFTYQNQRWAILAHIDVTKHKQVELALKKSQRLLQEAQRVARLGHWELDQSLGRPIWSKEIFNILGLKVEDGEPCFVDHKRYVHPDDWPVLQERVTRAATDGTPFDFVLRIRRQHGEPGWMRVIGTANKDDQGRVTDLFGVAQDVTTLREAEAAVRESERMLNVTGKMAKIGGWVHDLTTGGTTWTEALYDIIEIPYDQTPPGPEAHLNYYPPVDRERLRQAYNRAVQDGVPFDLELQVHTTTGKLIWCRAQGEPVFEAGQCVRVRGIFQDITEQKQAEARIRSLARFPAEDPYPVLRIGADGIIRYANSSGEVLLADLGTEVSGPVPSRWRTALERTLESRSLERIEEETAHGLFALHVRPIADAGYVNIYGVDITARRQVEKHLCEMRSESILVAERERRRIAVELHDRIGQGLAMAKFSLQTLETEVEPDLAKRLTQTCDGLDELVEQTRSLSFELSNSILYTVGLEAALEAFIESVVRPEYGLCCTIETHGNLRELNPDMRFILYRTARELITNVIKHASAQHLRVTARRIGDQVTCRIEDDGQGFDPETVKSPDLKGKHFGLFSIYEQMDALGGMLDISSQRGQGTRATFRVPIQCGLQDFSEES